MEGGGPPRDAGVDNTESKARSGKYASRRRRLSAWLVSVVCLVAIILLASPWFLLIPFYSDHQPMWPGGSSTFTMVGSTPNEISVPNCALVSVWWADTVGRVVGFGSYQGGPAHLVSSCPDGALPLAPESPPNHCAPSMCNYTGAIIDSTEGTYQIGSSGTLQFVDTQGPFGFYAEVNGTNSMSQGPISVHYSYSVPVFSAGISPPGSPSPTLTPREWVFFAPVVVAVWVMSIRFLRKRMPPPLSGMGSH